MNINRMRKIDYYAGVPLTALVSLFFRLTRFFRRKADPSRVKKVLFIELSEMGSAILADATLRKVGRRYETYFVIFKKNAVSLKLLNPLPFENVFCIREDSFWTLTWDSLRFLIWCRRTGIDAIVDLELFSRYTMLLSGLGGAFVRVGFVNPNSEGLYRGSLLTHSIAYNPHIHITQNFVALVEPLFQAPEDKYYVKRVIPDGETEIALAQIPSAILERVKEKVRAVVPSADQHSDIVLVNANAGDLLPHRRWQKDKFATLIQKLLDAHPSLMILLTGSPSERAGVDEVAVKVSHERCVNFAGHVTFEELPGLYKISRAIVTNDSGPAHFASAVGLKTFVLFGPETPRLYGPLRNSVSITAGLACSPCVSAANHRNTACRDNVCMKAIMPEFVFKQMDDYLNGRRLTSNNAEILTAE